MLSQAQAARLISQRQAHENPGSFLTLVGKVLPLQVSGEGGGAITIEVITGVPGDDD